MFEKITQVKGLESLRNSSTSYSHECITKKCDIGRDVWIKYFKNENEYSGTFTISDSNCGIGDVATIMLYIENNNESNEKIYDVYRYKGNLVIDRRCVGTMRQDILSNIDDILAELKPILMN